MRRVLYAAALSVACASGSEAERPPQALEASASAESAPANPNRDALLALKDAPSASTSASSSAGVATASAATVAPTADPNPSSSAAARQLFQDGTTAFRKGDYPAARAAFQASYSLLPNPSVLLNIGQAALKEGDRAFGCQTLQRYVVESKPPIAPDKVKELKKDCPKLK